MFEDLFKGWQLVNQAYLDKSLAGGKLMFWYLTACIVVIGGVYMYLYWQGAVGLAVLFSSLAGVRPPVNGIPINIIHAIGIVLILRYVLFSGLSKKAPQNLENRLREIESKTGELHKLAFGDVESPKEEEEHGRTTAKTSAGKKAKGVSKA